MQKIGWFGCQGSLEVISNVTIRQSAYDFLFDFNRNHASILYRFRDIAGYLLKVADFDPPHVHLAPTQGVIPVEFRGDLWRQKSRVPGLSCDGICVILRLAVLVEHRLVTDRWTDRQTEGHRAMASTADAQHRAVKIHQFLSSIKKDAHKRKPVPFLPHGLYSSLLCSIYISYGRLIYGTNSCKSQWPKEMA